MSQRSVGACTHCTHANAFPAIELVDSTSRKTKTVVTLTKGIPSYWEDNIWMKIVKYVKDMNSVIGLWIWW